MVNDALLSESSVDARRYEDDAAAAAPKERRKTSGGEYTSCRDGHLWFAAMRSAGIDDATAIKAGRPSGVAFIF